MENFGIILLVVFLMLLVVGPFACVRILRNESFSSGQQEFNPQPREIYDARQKLVSVTTCSTVTDRCAPSPDPSPDADVEAVAPPSEFGECPICIGPLVPEPAHHAADNDDDDNNNHARQPSVDALSTKSGSAGASRVVTVNASPCATGPSEDDEDDDILTLNSCGHSFHSKCLSSWFLIQRFDCPVCRLPYYKGHRPEPPQQRRLRTLASPPFY